MSVTITTTLPAGTSGGVVAGAYGAIVTTVLTGPPGAAGPPGSGAANAVTFTAQSLTTGQQLLARHNVAAHAGMVGLTIHSAAEALVVNQVNQCNDTSGDLAMTLPTGAQPGDWIIVEKVGGSALAHGNKVNVTGNMRGVPATTINLTLYRQSDTYIADSSGSWWPQQNRMVLGTMDNRWAQLFPTAPSRTNINGTLTVIAAPAGTDNGDRWLRMTAGICPLQLPGPGIVDAAGNPAMVTLTLRIDQDATGGRDFSVPTGAGIPTVAWVNGGTKPNLATLVAANAGIVIDAVSYDGGATYLAFAPVPAVTTAQVILQSLAAGKGDMIAATAPGAWARFGVGADGKVLTADSTATVGASWQTPAAATTASPRLSDRPYHPGTAQTDITTTSTTFADVAAAGVAAGWSAFVLSTLDATIIAPANGRVKTKGKVFVKASASAGVKMQTFDVGAGAAVATTVNTVLQATSQSLGSAQIAVCYEENITGLTPGASYTFRPQWALVGSGTATMSVGGATGSLQWSVEPN